MSDVSGNGASALESSNEPLGARCDADAADDHAEVARTPLDVIDANRHSARHTFPLD